MLNLTQLKVLAAVARHGSVTEAAKELHYSQPSVSHHLGRLEAATGARLIQRVGRGIRLTPEGELLARAGDGDPGTSGRRIRRAGRPRGTSCRTGTTRRFPNGPQHPRTEGSRRAVPVAPGNRVEPRRCPPGRGPDDAAFRTRRHRLDLPARRHSAGGGGTPTHPPAGRPPLPRSATNPISVSRTTVTPPGSAAANAVGPPRSRHASAPASHHASPTPATTRSSPSRWWPPEWVSPSSTDSRCMRTGCRASTPHSSPTAPARSTPPRTATRRTRPPRPR